VSLKEDKQHARILGRAIRKAISSGDRNELSKIICELISTSTAWSRSNVVLTYFAAGSEVDLCDLFGSLRQCPDESETGDEDTQDQSVENEQLDGLGLADRRVEEQDSMRTEKIKSRVARNLMIHAVGPETLGAPIVEGENMRFGHVRTGEDGSPQTILGPYGLREPDGPPVNLRDVGLILVPLLAYDSAGNRLGSGKGFYDRFLAANPELAERAVIMGVAFSAQQVEELATEPHDYQLDAVVTELGITNWRTPT
jgi:5,10-methenyltetrahydrofolate synthetase